MIILYTLIIMCFLNGGVDTPLPAFSIQKGTEVGLFFGNPPLCDRARGKLCRIEPREESEDVHAIGLMFFSASDGYRLEIEKASLNDQDRLLDKLEVVADLPISPKIIDALEGRPGDEISPGEYTLEDSEDYWVVIF